MECDYCAYNAYDEDTEEYYCSVNLDEDDMARFLSRKYKWAGNTSQKPPFALM